MEEITQRTTRPELLTTAEAAVLLATTPATLNTWRCTRAVNVPYVRIGKNIRYRRRDLDAFVDAKTVGGEAVR